MICYKKISNAKALIEAELKKSNPDMGFINYLKNKYGVWLTWQHTN